METMVYKKKRVTISYIFESFAIIPYLKLISMIKCTRIRYPNVHFRNNPSLSFSLLSTFYPSRSNCLFINARILQLSRVRKKAVSFVLTLALPPLPVE